MNKQRARFVAALALALALSCGAATAQESGVRVYEEELRVQLDEQSIEPRDSGLDGGGWFNYALFHFTDSETDRTRTLQQYSVRAWGAANLQGVQQVYVRGLFSWNNWNRGDNTSNTDEEFGQVERAWYQYSLAQDILNKTGKPAPLDFRIKVGREYTTIGTGLVLALPLDMVQMDFTIPGWEFKALLGKTLPDTPNIDQSLAVENQEMRDFFGGQVTYTGVAQHRPFIYFLGQDDHTTPEPKDPAQAYGYSSRYLGTGSSGTLVLPELRYQAEAVWEFGREYSFLATRADEQDSICAMGLDALLEYSWRAPTHPQFTVEYLRGSGDADRQTSGTSTIGGNELGTRDKAFNAFGYRDTGIALAPNLANLNIYVAGASFYPLEKVQCFRKMQVGTKAFFYQKSVADGAISDSTADRHDSWVGWEWDAFFDWRITSDLSWTVRYGAFQPGEAYSDRETRQFLYTGVSLSF
jgi:hypothetical protein